MNKFTILDMMILIDDYDYIIVRMLLIKKFSYKSFLTDALVEVVPESCKTSGFSF